MDTKEKRKADKKARAVEIHGENCVSLSRILEDLLHPTPSHAEAVERAEAFIEAERVRRRSVTASPIPDYDRKRDGDYMSFLVAHNCD